MRETLGTWDFEPISVIALLLLTVLYFVGLRRTNGRSLKLIPWWRPVALVAGVSSLLIASLSPLHTVGGSLFFAHMIQHIILIMIGPPLILLGGPIVPVIRGLPAGLRREIVIPILQNHKCRTLLQICTKPVVAWFVYVGSLWIWHTPRLYDEAVQNTGIHGLEHVSFVFASIFFWWCVIDPIPMKPKLTGGLRLGYLFLATLQNTILGAFITLSTSPWYSSYMVSSEIFTALTPLQDQRIGGLIMWIPGAMMYFLALSIAFFVMIFGEERRVRLMEQKSGRRH